MAGAGELLAGLAVPALLVAPDGGISMANLAAETLLNTSQPALAERGWEAAFAGDATVPALIDRARREDSSCAAYDVELALAFGRPVRVDVLINQVAEAPGWLAVAFQSRSVATMVDRQAQQQGAARSAEGVAQMLAHEIKNPLSGIRGAAQLLSSEGVGAEDRDELTMLIVNEVDRIAKLVDRLESFTDTRPVTLRPENIHELLGHVRRVAARGFAQGMRIRERYDPSLPLVAANRDAMIQVFMNLLKNAAEATGEGGEIGISTSFRPGLKVRPAGGGEVVSLPLEVRVTDNGPGLPEAIADHVFKPFVTSKPGGSGLGLALVAKIVADHGGVVEYERNMAMKQTIFRILLPVAS
ncbi:two-component system sensor histidine kinase NtrB [Polymorphobacter sp.]|uniref:two-component system sensor histidine kinase NtrB n=1 Tax=Polymorphobacter sp. TaxID=1909290 RepID=UPI003F708B6D